MTRKGIANLKESVVGNNLKGRREMGREGQSLSLKTFITIIVTQLLFFVLSN